MTNAIIVQIRRLPGSEGLPLPGYMTANAAGMDLHAAIDTDLAIAAGQIVLVPTGLEVAIPDGFEGRMRPRSGLAVKHGINRPTRRRRLTPTTAADSRAADQSRARAFTVSRGMRIAQLVVAPIARVTWDEVTQLPVTARASGGFGHSGV